jgi:hypothetical protein
MLALFLASAVAATPPAFTHPLALATYATVRGGAYSAEGLGGRARWEPFARAGLELYLEATIVNWQGGFRHDYPNGFSVYAPIAVGPVRFRPYLGACDVLSFVEPMQPGAPRADDVMLGAHAGLGTEVAVSRSWSLFADAQTDLYAGHDRSSGKWTGDVAEVLSPFWTGQVNVGVQLHLSRELFAADL